MFIHKFPVKLVSFKILKYLFQRIWNGNWYNQMLVFTWIISILPEKKSVSRKTCKNAKRISSEKDFKIYDIYTWIKCHLTMISRLVLALSTTCHCPSVEEKSHSCLLPCIWTINKHKNPQIPCKLNQGYPKAFTLGTKNTAHLYWKFL